MLVGNYDDFLDAPRLTCNLVRRAHSVKAIVMNVWQTYLYVRILLIIFYQKKEEVKN